MADRIKIKIPPAIVTFLRPDSSTEVKLRGLEDASGMSACDQVLLIVCLMQDTDSVVKGAASTLFGSLPPEPLIEFIQSGIEIHPVILDLIAQKHGSSAEVVHALLKNDALSHSARQLLQEVVAENETLQESAVDVTADEGSSEIAKDDEELEPVDEKGEEFQSKYKLALSMGIADKIKTALTGDKEWRSLLIKDANKLVSGSVVKNPRITEAEVLTIAKGGVQNDEIMRLICSNKEWVKNYKIRKALVENPRTPLPNALRYLSTLGEKDLAAYAKSKNVSTVISTQSRRLLQSKKK
ncbi:MAG: hypothetical protein WCP33_00035 [Deltaproteobacteria bacterium]